MMVTFVSQCEKNALKKTRRVLDAFANRIHHSRTFVTNHTVSGHTRIHGAVVYVQVGSADSTERDFNPGFTRSGFLRLILTDRETFIS